MPLTPRPIPRGANPFPMHGITRDVAGVAHYDDLPASLIEMLRARVAAAPDAEAVAVIGGPRCTYRELWDRAARVAGGLRAAGVGAGDRVALRHPTSLDWVVGFWGALMAGAIVVLVNTRFTPPEVAFVLADADVKADLAPDLPTPDGPPFVAADLALADIAALFYTSGTTGSPKGVPTTHEAFLAIAESVLRFNRFPPDIGPAFRTLISVPLFHVTGCNSQLVTALYLGGAAVLLPAYEPVAFCRALGAERISFLVTVPAIYALVLRHPAFATADLSHIRWAAYGGAPIATSLVLAIQAALPGAQIANGYGMTESASVMTALPHADAAAHADSIGFAMPIDDLAILPLGDGHDAGQAGWGELLVRGSNITAGYWRRPDETAAALLDGWLRTGDVVRVDADGRIYLVDRIKDIVIRGGENVSSVEVEDALAAAPGVAEAAVLGVPDTVMGEQVGAVLVPVGGGAIAPDAVRAYLATRLAAFKIPAYIVVRAAPLPRNAGGKILKAVLRGETDWGPLR